MAFSAKRGRPRTQRPVIDKGTRELVARRAYKLTMEPLDLCLERRLVSEEEHKAGIHLRWLHTLRFGAPTVSAYDHAAVGGRNVKQPCETWQQHRESEYKQAIMMLKQVGADIIVTNIAVFNRFPRFLLPPKGRGIPALSTQMVKEQELTKLREGLALLHDIFAEMRYRRR